MRPSDYRKELAPYKNKALPEGWHENNFGTINLQGSASYSNGSFSVKGSSNTYTNSQRVWFAVCKKFKGDFSFQFRVNILTAPNHESCAGILLRERTEEESDYYYCVVHKSGFFTTNHVSAKTGYQYIDSLQFNNANIFFKIEKTHKAVTVLVRDESQDWVVVLKLNQSFKDDSLFVCLTSASRDPIRLSSSEFKIITP